jgi:transposase
LAGDASVVLPRDLKCGARGASLSQNPIFFECAAAREDRISMAQPIAPDYGQQFLFPPALEDWVPADHPVRFLREFVDQLDLPALHFALPAAVNGRPPYHPSLLLKIWLYGYYFRIRASRKLEAACAEVLPLVWLCGLIKPDHNSLWRFWDENKNNLRALFKQTVSLALRTGCVGLALQALDGTKIQAAASTARGWNQERMEKLLAALDEVIDQTELKIAQENADLAAPRAAHLPAGMAERKALREQIKKGLAQLAADQRQHYHPVEPEARRMKLRDQNRYAYNAQAVADEKEGILVACDTTRHENDGGLLVPLIEQARENLGVAASQTLTLADQGYGAGADVAAAAEKNLPLLVTPAEGTPAGDNPYAAQHFTYDARARTVTCPRGHMLDHEGATTKKRNAGRALPLPLPRLSGARALHARSQRAADRSMAAHSGGAGHASATGGRGGANTVGTAAGDHRTALCADQTTRRVPALDRVGFGRSAGAMGAALRDAQPARALPPLAGGAADGRGGGAEVF